MLSKEAIALIKENLTLWSKNNISMQFIPIILEITEWVNQQEKQNPPVQNPAPQETPNPES